MFAKTSRLPLKSPVIFFFILTKKNTNCVKWVKTKSLSNKSRTWLGELTFGFLKMHLSSISPPALVGKGDILRLHYFHLLELVDLVWRYHRSTWYHPNRFLRGSSAYSCKFGPSATFHLLNNILSRLLGVAKRVPNWTFLITLMLHNDWHPLLASWVSYSLLPVLFSHSVDLK